MWELDHKESWALKNWCFWTVVLEKILLRIPWTARRSNQCILNEINSEYSSEGPMLKLKLQYFGHLMQRTDSLEKTLMLGKIEGRRRRGQQRMRWLDGITRWTWVWVSSRSWWWTGRPGVLQSTGSQRVGYTWETELHWTMPGMLLIWERERTETYRFRDQSLSWAEEDEWGPWRFQKQGPGPLGREGGEPDANSTVSPCRSKWLGVSRDVWVRVLLKVSLLDVHQKLELWAPLCKDQA